MPSPPPHHLRRTLKHLPTDDHFSKLRAAAARLRPPPASARPRTLRSLSRSGDADALLDLASKSPAISSEVFFFNTLINAFIVSRCRAQAVASFAHLSRSGKCLTNPSYSILLKLQFLLEADSESPYSIVSAMVRAGCEPDTVTYSTLISGLCRAGRIEEAWGVLDKMEEMKCLPTVRCYTSLVLGYCNDGRIDEARHLVDWMESFGCHPDAVTYTILIDAMCRRGEVEEARRVLGESGLRGWRPNEVTYNVFIHGLCKVGRINEAFRELDAMRVRGLSLTMETLHILFDSLARDLSEDLLWKVVGMLSWDVDAFFYNTLVNRLCRNGRGTGDVLKLLAVMLKRGMLDLCTYTIIINSLCRRSMLEAAEKIYSHIHHVADGVALNTLLMGFNKAEEYTAVHRLFNTERRNISLNEYTYVILIDSLCREHGFREAVNLFLVSIGEGFSPNLISRPLSWLVKDGKRWEILKLFEEMLERGLVLDTRTFNSLIRAFCKNGLCQSVESDFFYLFFDRMLGIK